MPGTQIQERNGKEQPSIIDPLRILCPLVTGSKPGYCDCPNTRETVLKLFASCYSGVDCMARKCHPEEAKKEYSKQI